MIGWIFCLTNEMMPGLVKIAMTESIDKTPEIRAKELYTPGVPMHFNIVMKKMVNNPKQTKKNLHHLLSKYTKNVNKNRDFFQTTPEEVLQFFNLIDEYKEDVPSSPTYQLNSEKRDEYWNKFKVQKKQLIIWANIKNKKTEYNGKESLPSISSMEPIEATAARLRQRVKARQATPNCWPKKNDSIEIIKFKEKKIEELIGGKWFE